MAESGKKPHQPFIPNQTDLPELTIKALLLGLVMAVVLGAANAYLGMAAGLTVAATFPAAVVAMAALRLPFMKGNILEENIARTTASVGEALVAGAIFTIPAFVLSGVWESLRWVESASIMAVGGVIGVLFVILVRRTLVEETDLPYPEAIAAAEMVKAGQGGETGAKYLFSAMGIAALLEFFKNSAGMQFVQGYVSKVIPFTKSKIQMLTGNEEFSGSLYIQTPDAAPALMGVGFIVGFRISAVLFTGALLGWLVLVPLAVFANPGFGESVDSGQFSWLTINTQVWSNQIRPLAVGTMIVAAFSTLWGLRKSLVDGIGRAFGDLSKVKGGTGTIARTSHDIDFKKVLIGVGGVTVLMFFLYLSFAGAAMPALVLTVTMVFLGFFFVAVAGYLVALIGSSNNPISGLTLSSLLIAALLMVMLNVQETIGITAGIGAVLAVAGVVCCAAGIGGDMMQDLKVGHILGGTPWKMELAEIIGVFVAALALTFPLIALDEAYGIGGAQLPAPQAGLMALLARGIIGGEMPWALVIMGALMGIGLILIKAPSPMLIAVGMYLPFFSTAAIFVGGIFKWTLEKILAKQKANDEQITKANNTGTLIASGFVAGQTLMAVALAFVVLGTRLAGSDFQFSNFGIGPFYWPAVLIILFVGWYLVNTSLKQSRT